MIHLAAGRFFGETLRVARFGPFAITASHYRAGDRLPRHCHEKPYLYVMLAGGIAERAECRDNLCSRGWLIYNEAGEAHQDQVLDHGALGLNIELSADWLKRLAEAGGVRRPVLYQHAGPAVTAIGRLQVALASPCALQPLGVEEAIVRLIGSLCKSAAPSRHPRPWLSEVEELIRSRRGAELSLSEISETAGVHPAHLCREFRRNLGVTMTQYAARLRADWALEEIMGCRTALSEIAVRTGFADQAHLTRTIHRYFGNTPGRLRRQR
jgi:AraC family transcriptional regulator